MSGRTEVRHVPKPWGHETIWAANELYVGKILHVNAGQKLSVQYHVQKDETVYLLSGEIRYCVQLDGSDTPRDMQLKAGEAFRVPPGPIHYMEARTHYHVLRASPPHPAEVVAWSVRGGAGGSRPRRGGEARAAVQRPGRPHHLRRHDLRRGPLGDQDHRRGWNHLGEGSRGLSAVRRRRHGQ